MSAQLDATEELEESSDTSQSASQGVSGSPPHETKIRQISQGVEDLTWKNMAKHPTPPPEREPPESEDKHEAMETEQDGPARGTQPGEAVMPALLQGENPPLVLEDAGVDEHAGEADPAEVPPVAQQETQPEETSPVTSTEDQKEEATPSTPPQRAASPIIVSPLPDTLALSRRGSESSVEEKGLKRKLADRTISESGIHADLVEDGGSATHSTATKRPRDDPDTDANPRVTKRPTPPPEEDEKEGSSSKPRSKPSDEAAPPPKFVSPFVLLHASILIR